MNTDLTALDDHILRTLGFMTGGIVRLVNVKQLAENLEKPPGQPVGRAELEASLQRLESHHLIDGRKGRVGYMLAKMTDEAVAYIHQSQPGVPSFYTRNVDALSTKELHKFIDELNQRLATSGVGGRDYELTKEKIGQVQYRLSSTEGSSAKRIAVLSLILAGIATLSTVAQALIPVLWPPKQ